MVTFVMTTMTTLFFRGFASMMDVEHDATAGQNTDVPSLARYTICALKSGVVPMLPAAAGVKTTQTWVAPAVMR